MSFSPPISPRADRSLCKYWLLWFQVSSIWFQVTSCPPFYVLITDIVIHESRVRLDTASCFTMNEMLICEINSVRPCLPTLRLLWLCLFITLYLGFDTLFVVECKHQRSLTAFARPICRVIKLSASRERGETRDNGRLHYYTCSTTN